MIALQGSDVMQRRHAQRCWMWRLVYANNPRWLDLVHTTNGPYQILLVAVARTSPEEGLGTAVLVHGNTLNLSHPDVRISMVSCFFAKIQTFCPD